MATYPIVLLTLIVCIVSARPVLVSVSRAVGGLLGRRLLRRSKERRRLIKARVHLEETEYYEKIHARHKPDDDDWERVEGYGLATAKNGDKAPDDWEGFVGFFHPFCNAGGGGERVLWAAIKATQKRWPKAVCVVYTGDHNIDKNDMIARVEERFNIQLHAPTVVFLYMSSRKYVLSSTYPRLTLLGQSLGSMILGWEALSLLVPDVFVDTMGYAFALGLVKLVVPHVQTGAYVHYPTISTDMIGSLDKGGQGLNAGAGSGFRGTAKRTYWKLFAWIYSVMGGHIDVVMTNSSWTQEHILSLWGPHRRRHNKADQIEVVYPPVAVEELETQIEVSPDAESRRQRNILCIAQFRPEKNHGLIIRAFASFLEASKLSPPVRLVLIGSVRNSEDATRVYELRLLAHELKIRDQVEFVCDASWPDILAWLKCSWIGVNGMWNEHFGIGVVEYQAAGLISVVHDSGGPKADIVVDYEGGPTGFHATTAPEFASAFERTFQLSAKDIIAMRRRSQASAKRFTEEAFATKWIVHMERLVDGARR